MFSRDGHRRAATSPLWAKSRPYHTVQTGIAPPDLADIQALMSELVPDAGFFQSTQVGPQFPRAVEATLWCTA